jgi:UDP-glucose 4-epimerase
MEFVSMKKILVTGTAGYIGSQLLPMVRAHYQNAEIFTCDVRDNMDYKDITGQEFDLVFHFGAVSIIMDSFKMADKMMAINALNLIGFFQNNKVKRFIFPSTGAIYGDRDTPAKEEDANWVGCISPYAQSKYVAESIIRQMCPNHLITRFGNVYGGNYNPRVEMLAFSHFKQDDPIVLYGGRQTRDFIHVNEICRAVIAGADRDICGTFNLANGVPVLIRDVAQQFATQRGVRIEFREQRKGDVSYIVLDVAKAREAGLLPQEPFVNDYNS